MVPKFRVWCKNRNEWERDVCYIQQDGLLYQRYRGSERLIPTLTKNHVVMQSTGLQDKNGVEIFEGFAVYHEEGEFSYKGIVRKDKYYFYIEGIGINDSFSFDDVSDTQIGEADLVVFGNIYENPELLEQANEI